MKYHLYFHDDLDGMASAALMLDFLRTRGDSVSSYNPIDYTPKTNKTWPRFKFKKPFVLVDFRYHPAADWWFDHHRSSFTSPALPAWRKTYRNDKTHQSNSKFKSCYSLVLAHLKKNFGYKPSRHIAELAKNIDLIDGALYRSPGEAITLKSYIIKLGAYTYHEKDKKLRTNLVKNLSSKNLKSILADKHIVRQVKEADKEIKSNLKYVKRMAVLGPKTVFVDCLGVSSDVSHYMTYNAFSKVKYSLLFEKITGGYHLGVGFNRWQADKFCVDISKIMEKYGGGGHHTVGAVERESKKEIMKIAQEIIEYLNKHG